MATVTALLHVTPRSRAVLPTLLEIYDAQGEAEPETEEEARRRDEHEEASAGIGAVAVALMLAQSGRAAIEVPTLVKLITGQYRRGIRLTFIYALAELEADCRAAVPALRKLMLDDDLRIRSAAGWAVLRIEGDGAELPAILKAVGHDPKDSAEFQNSVSMFLKEKAETVQWLSDEADQIAALVRQVRYDNPFYQRQAIRFLGEIGPKAKLAVPALITAARSEDKFTRDVARAALKQIDLGAVRRESETDPAK
jgi:HEAT repeat protein